MFVLFSKARYKSCFCERVMFAHKPLDMCNIFSVKGDLSQSLHIVKAGHCVVVTDDFTKVAFHFSVGDYFGEVEVCNKTGVIDFMKPFGLKRVNGRVLFLSNIKISTESFVDGLVANNKMKCKILNS